MEVLPLEVKRSHLFFWAALASRMVAFHTCILPVGDGSGTALGTEPYNLSFRLAVRWHFSVTAAGFEVQVRVGNCVGREVAHS